MQNKYGAISTRRLDEKTYDLIKKYQDKGLIILELKMNDGKTIKLRNKFVSFREKHTKGIIVKLVIYKSYDDSELINFKNSYDKEDIVSERYYYQINEKK